MKTKMIMVAVMMAVIAVVFAGINAKAAVRDDVVRARFGQEFEDEFKSAEEEFKEMKEEGDEAVEGIEEIKVSYTEIGLNIYDIRVDAKLTRGIDVAVHLIYDAVEDENLTDYAEVKGERIDTDEFMEMFPEVNGL